MAKTHLFTSESVTEGHPDKLADQISDAALDALLVADPHAHVALETFLTRGLAVVGGELTCREYVDIANIVRKTVNETGYTRTEYGFDGDTCGVTLAIQDQSRDINQGVDRGDIDSQGAGDQGMMFGYACDETESLMPLPITIAHALTAQYSAARKANPDLGIRPDGKSQVTVVYSDGKPVSVDALVLAMQHDDRLTTERVHQVARQYIIDPVIERFAGYFPTAPKLHINPTGRFVIGGPQGDTGLTGRKIIVDTYGGYARHGGGAFSGKDPSKVDRSAAYVARWLAKNVVAAGLAAKVEIQLAYAIGEPEPVSVFVDTFGTGKVADEVIAGRLQDKSIVSLRPGRIIERLGLLYPGKGWNYAQTARNGHFGNAVFPWEQTDLAAKLA